MVTNGSWSKRTRSSDQYRDSWFHHQQLEIAANCNQSSHQSSSSPSPRFEREKVHHDLSLTTSVDDQLLLLLKRTRIKGGGKEHSLVRSTRTVTPYYIGDGERWTKVWTPFGGVFCLFGSQREREIMKENGVQDPISEMLCKAGLHCRPPITPLKPPPPAPPPLLPISSTSSSSCKLKIYRRRNRKFEGLIEQCQAGWN